MDNHGINKINRPPVIDAVPRTSLFELLDKSASYPVIWISGPPGSGKSTLVSSYVERCNYPCLWYSLDGEDRDCASLFQSLHLAARNLLKDNSLVSLTHGPMRDQGLHCHARDNFKKLFSLLPPGSILVLDNLHELPHESTFFKHLAQSIHYMPKGFRIFFISRSSPGLFLSRLLANRKLRRIGTDALRFTLEETKALLHVLSRDMLHREGLESLDDAFIAQVHASTRGWAAGMILLAGSARLSWKDIQELFLEISKCEFDTESKPWRQREPWQLLSNYFLTEVMINLGPAEQDFLLKTAYFPAMTVDMAVDISRNTAAADILEALRTDQCFTESLMSRPLQYQYHPLFRVFLIAQAAMLLSLDELVQVKSKAAEILAAWGDMESSASLYAQLGQWDHLRALLRTKAPAMIETDRASRFFRLLKVLPGPQIQEDPWLLYWAGMARQAAHPGHGRKFLEWAFKRFNAGDESEGALMASAALVNVLVFKGDIDGRLDPLMDWMLSHLAKHPAIPDPVLEARVAAAMTSSLVWKRPRHPDLQAWVYRSKTAAGQCPDPVLRLLNAVHILDYYFWTGQVVPAQLFLEEVKASLALTTPSPCDSVILGVKEALTLSWTCEDATQAMAIVDACIDLAAKHGIQAPLPVILAHGAFAALSHGYFSKAKKLLRRMQNCLESWNDLAQTRHHLLASWHDLLCGKPKKALAHVHAASKLVRKLGSPFLEAQHCLALATTMHAAGEKLKARNQLARAKKTAASLRSKSLQFACLLTRAGFDLEDQCGLDSLAEALAMGSREGYLNTPWGWDRAMMTRLCLKALENGIQVAYVQGLILCRGLYPDSTRLIPPNWPWTCRIHALGAFRIEILPDKPTASSMVKGKPRTLLKVLVALGCRDVPASLVVDALWPEAEGDAGLNVLKFTLHGLRKSLPNAGLLLFKDGVLSLDERLVWIDTLAFEDLADAALEQWRTGEDAELAIRTSEQALALYAGDFLAQDMESPWAVVMRERLRSKLVRIVQSMGMHLAYTDRLEKAASCYAKALETHPAQEEFHRELIRCYLATGRKAEALAAYRRCVSLLHAVLGIEPSEETTALLTRQGLQA